jgi:serine/threonine protein kinase
LKLENFLVDGEGTPKFMDFGLAQQLNSASGVWCEDAAGTPCYMSPEVMGLYMKSKNRDTDEASEAAQRGLDLHFSTKRAARPRGLTGDSHGLNTDVWSMGIVVQEIAKLSSMADVVEPLVKFALIRDRTSRPSAQDMLKKLNADGIRPGNKNDKDKHDPNPLFTGSTKSVQRRSR